MKDWKLNTAVSVCIWTRPGVLEQTFGVIKEVRPRTLFLISDAGRNDEEWKLIKKSREIVEDVDWECEIHKLYMSENQGMYAMARKWFEFVFDNTEECIFLEDDILASESFFYFCEELLKKYRYDTRVGVINGMNAVGCYDRDDVDYTFSNGGMISGYAMWKRTYDLFRQQYINRDSDFIDNNLEKELETYCKYNKNDLIAKSCLTQYKGYEQDEFYGGHPAGIEFYRGFANIIYNMLDIVPCKNLITNLGAGGTHIGDLRLIPKRHQKFFNQKRYELEFPLKHPKYVIRDREFEHQLTETPLIVFGMKVEALIRHAIYLPPRVFWKKVFRKVTKKNKSVER